MSPTTRTRRIDGNQSGFGLIELMAVMAIFAVLSAAGLMTVDQRRDDMHTSQRRVLADFRWTRMRAIVTGDHFRFHLVSPNQYQVEHLERASGAWQVKSVVRSVVLPSHISLATTAAQVELNGRGVVVFADPNTASPGIWTLSDNRFSASRQLILFPSGQLHAAS